VAHARWTRVAPRGAEQVDVAELAPPDPLARGGPVWVEAAVEPDLQLHACRGGGLDGLNRRLQLERDRLLTEDVLSGLGGSADHLGVERRGRDQHDALDLGVLQQVVVAGRPLDAELLAGGARRLLVGVDYANELDGRRPSQIL